MKKSQIDKAIEELIAKREPLQQQVDAINLAINALRDQQMLKPTPKPRKARAVDKDIPEPWKDQ